MQLTPVRPLLSLKGVGEWTVDMFLLFHLRRHSIVPYLDVAFQKAVQAVYDLRAPPDVTRCGPVTWTPAELDFITDLYLKHVRPEQEHDARSTILREFRTRFQTHSDDAVELTVRRIIRLDTAYPSEGMLGAHVGYWEILESKAPGRFDPPAVAN